jgi:hypothetical protein
LHQARAIRLYLRQGYLACLCGYLFEEGFMTSSKGIIFGLVKWKLPQNRDPSLY